MSGFCVIIISSIFWRIKMLVCPVCGENLIKIDKTQKCPKGHSFDIAKEGYVNLLLSSKNGDSMGDDRFSARSRRDFLNSGYYEVLKNALVELFSDKCGTLLDICCGEGYYTSAVGKGTDMQVFGFDLSREMVRLAAKRGGAEYFVANMASIPVADGAFDYAMHLFAPFNEKEFARILKSGGRLYTVVPGSHHLFGLKEKLYDKPYLNDEKLPETESLRLLSRRKISAEIELDSAEAINAVFRMTPYYFHTSEKDKAKLDNLCSLKTSIEFIIGEYEK